MTDSIKTDKIWQQDKNHFIHPYTDFSTFHEEGSQVITKAKGNFVSDSQGNTFLDGIAGLWCVNIGHGREDMADAIHKQITQMQYFNPFGHSTNAPASELAAEIAKRTPGELNHVFFTSGGSVSNDSDFRIIHYYNNLRGKTTKKKIISRDSAYHGSTYFAANLTGIQATKSSFDSLGDELISYVSAADMYRRPIGAEQLTEDEYACFLANELENHILRLGADNVAAFILEPVMGAGGVLVAPKGYHKKCADICRKYDVLVVADEVVTAFGRLGQWFSSEAIFDFVPDVLITAKGINSGYIPLGATIISAAIYRVISQPQCEGGVFSMGFTYSGHATACAAALKNFEILEQESLFDNVNTLGPYLQQTARETLLTNPIVGDVRGIGFMLAVDLVSNKQTKERLYQAQRVFEKCIEKGLIIRPVGNIIVISPPLTLNKDNIDSLISKLKEAIDEVSAEVLLEGKSNV